MLLSSIKIIKIENNVIVTKLYLSYFGNWKVFLILILSHILKLRFGFFFIMTITFPNHKLTQAGKVYDLFFKEQNENEVPFYSSKHWYPVIELSTVFKAERMAFKSVHEMAIRYISKEFIRISFQIFLLKNRHHLDSFICIVLIRYKRSRKNQVLRIFKHAFLFAIKKFYQSIHPESITLPHLYFMFSNFL